MEDEYEEPGCFCRWIARWGGGPLWLAVGVSIFFLLLVARGDFLPPSLSLDLYQAGSLIGVIVVGFFSFRMIRPKAWIQLRINPQPRKFALRPEVENKVDRRLHGKMEVRVWVAGPGPEVEAGESLDPRKFEPICDVGERGPLRGERFFPIRGKERPDVYLPLEDYLKFSDGKLVSREIRVQFIAEWVDRGSCERGVKTKYWRLDLTRDETESPVDRARIEDLFDPLEDPYEEGENGGG